MIVHPLSLDNIINNVDEKCIQPNAVDVRVSAFRCIDDIDGMYGDTGDYTNQLFCIDDKETVHKKKTAEIPTDDDGSWLLYRGVYEFTSPHYVTIPEGYAGYLITRSSLNRNGIFVLSGLYDTGYQGYIGGTLYNLNGRLKIKKGTRVCQFVLLKSESIGSYEGQYNHSR